MGWGFRTPASYPVAAIARMNRANTLARKFNNQAQQQSLIASAGMSGFYHAMDMVGNNGQMVIIRDRMTESSFVEAAEAFVDSQEDAGETLMDLCPYPEAVEEILMEAGEVIMSALDTGRQGKWQDKV